MNMKNIVFLLSTLVIGQQMFALSNGTLWDAAYQGNLPEVQRHINAGLNVNWINPHSQMPILFAALSAPQNKIETARMLLNAGARINLQNANGDTVLSLAADAGAPIETIEFLLNNGANPNIRNRNGQTALDRAMRVGLYPPANPVVISLLRGRGALRGNEL